MEHPMRRAAQALDIKTCEEVLGRCTSGVLALAGLPGEPPYAVPLSYAYRSGEIVFHGAAQGHKRELIAADPKASFCVVDADDVVASEYTTRYRSVICFGEVEVVEDAAEAAELLMRLGMRYGVGTPDECRAEVGRWAAKTCVLRMRVDRMTGKESGALAAERRAAAAGA